MIFNFLYYLMKASLWLSMSLNKWLTRKQIKKYKDSGLLPKRPNLKLISLLTLINLMTMHEFQGRVWQAVIPSGDGCDTETKWLCNNNQSLPLKIILSLDSEQNTPA